MNHTDIEKETKTNLKSTEEKNKKPLTTGISHYMMYLKLQIICKQYTTKNSYLDHLPRSVIVIL